MFFLHFGFVARGTPRQKIIPCAPNDTFSEKVSFRARETIYLAQLDAASQAGPSNPHAAEKNKVVFCDRETTPF